MNLYELAVAKALSGSGGGGGSSNTVRGTFTTPGEYGVNTLTLDYAGSGYPILAAFYVKGGYTNPSEPWASLVKRYAAGIVLIAKERTDVAPEYGRLGENYGSVLNVYKSSASDATAYTAMGNTRVTTFTTSSAGSNAGTLIRFRSNTDVSYYVAGSSYGLAPSVEYEYVVVYSE